MNIIAWAWTSWDIKAKPLGGLFVGKGLHGEIPTKRFDLPPSRTFGAISPCEPVAWDIHFQHEGPEAEEAQKDWTDLTQVFVHCLSVQGMSFHTSTELTQPPGMFCWHVPWSETLGLGGPSQVHRWPPAPGREYLELLCHDRLLGGKGRSYGAFQQDRREEVSGSMREREVCDWRDRGGLGSFRP